MKIINKEQIKKTIIYKILHRPYAVIKMVYTMISRKLKEFLFADEYDLIKKMTNSFEKVVTFKEAGYEEVKIPDVYGLSYGGKINMYFPSIDMICINRATISENSDIIITPKGAVWRKVESSMFSKSNPDDCDLAGFNENRIKVLKKKKEVYIQGKCFSLLGQFDNLWSHFILQFFPKLVYASEWGLFNDEITLLLPEYTDQNIIDAVHLIIDKYPKINIIYVNENISYICEYLYHINSVEAYTAQTDIQLIYDTIVPKCTIETLKRGIVEPLFKVDNKKTLSPKIYLVRRSDNRNVINWKEIEKYFEKKGFTMVDGQNYSLSDKIHMFHNAKEIVGPWSSAFMATFACSNAKIMTFSNSFRTVETWITGYCDVGKNKFLMITGKDLINKKSYPHSSFFIPISKIDKAYNEFIKE